MQNRSRLLLAGLTAAFMLAVAIGTAGATRLETNSQSWKIVFSALRFEAAGNSVTCPVTLEGSFHSRTISKVSGSLIGVDKVASLGACTGGTATVLTETLPWHVRYDSFTGTLPTITGVKQQLIGARFRIKPTGNVECLSGTTAEHPAIGIATIESGGRATSYRVDETRTIPLEGFVCSFAGNGRFIGTGTVTQGNGEALRVKLVA